MLDKLAGIEERYEEINRLLMEVGSDYQRGAELNSERVELEPLVTLTRNYRQVLDQLDEARVLRDSEDEDMRLLAEGEIEALQPKSEALERQIAVIGVGKTRFLRAEPVELVLRRRSRSPLYVTAVGLDLAEAASRIRAMHGPYRIPTLLKRADQLSRGLACGEFD